MESSLLGQHSCLNVEQGPAFQSLSIKEEGTEAVDECNMVICDEVPQEMISVREAMRLAILNLQFNGNWRSDKSIMIIWLSKTVKELRQKLAEIHDLLKEMMLVIPGHALLPISITTMIPYKFFNETTFGPFMKKFFFMNEMDTPNIGRLLDRDLGKTANILVEYASLMLSFYLQDEPGPGSLLDAQMSSDLVNLTQF